MNKVGFFRSIQLKFIIIYILLLVLAMQVIGAFFIKELEDRLLTNFKSSIEERMQLLSYNLEQAFEKERNEDADEMSLQAEVQQIIEDISTNVGSTSIQVIYHQGRILGTNREENDERYNRKCPFIQYV